MLATRIAPSVLKGVKHLRSHAEPPISDFIEEAIRELLKNYGNKADGK
jgi:hypothetical protein